MKSFAGFLRKPLVLGILIGLIGIGVGLLWGWVIQPVQWTDASPALLQSSYQEDYLRMTIDSYGVNGNRDLALKRWTALGDNAKNSLSAILQNPASQNTTLVSQFSAMVNGGSTQPVPTAASGSGSASQGSSGIGRIALIFLSVLAVLIVLFAAFKFLGARGRRKGSSPSRLAGDLSRQVELTDYAAMGQEAPTSHFVTTYVAGDDLFDDSFSVDSATGEFLGECGVGISETVGVGDPKKVSAFEVWLFDKNDIQTVTKVLLSSHAFNDANTYQRLKAKGEPIQVSAGQRITLETASLQMIATVSEVGYGEGMLPPESFFNRLTLELAIWQKSVPNG